jgi:hypothetical protein
MSATLGDTEFFEKELTRLHRISNINYQVKRTAIPLQFSYFEEPLPQTVENLVKKIKHRFI